MAASQSRNEMQQPIPVRSSSATSDLTTARAKGPRNHKSVFTSHFYPPPAKPFGPPPNQRKSVDQTVLADAYAYLHRLAIRCRHDPELVRAVVDALTAYGRGQIDETQLYIRTYSTFYANGSVQLHSDFASFLPISWKHTNLEWLQQTVQLSVDSARGALIPGPQPRHPVVFPSSINPPVSNGHVADLTFQYPSKSKSVGPRNRFLVKSNRTNDTEATLQTPKVSVIKATSLFETASTTWREYPQINEAASAQRNDYCKDILTQAKQPLGFTPTDLQQITPPTPTPSGPRTTFSNPLVLKSSKNGLVSARTNSPTHVQVKPQQRRTTTAALDASLVAHPAKRIRLSMPAQSSLRLSDTIDLTSPPIAENNNQKRRISLVHRQAPPTTISPSPIPANPTSNSADLASLKRFYPTVRSILHRSSRCYIHALCGQQFHHPDDVRSHHNGRGLSGVGCWARKGCPAGSAWNDHASCKIGIKDVTYRRVKGKGFEVLAWPEGTVGEEVNGDGVGAAEDGDDVGEGGDDGVSMVEGLDSCVAGMDGNDFGDDRYQAALEGMKGTEASKEMLKMEEPVNVEVAARAFALGLRLRK